MPVIAMTREMGSGGREVAERLAGRMADTRVERDLAQRLEVPERTIHHRIEGAATLRERWQVGSRRLAQFTAEEILGRAQRGNVLIRGWGACVFLRGVPHVARIRVCAPIQQRERSVMQRRFLKDPAAARQELGVNDTAHRRTLEATFGVDREDALLYDLVLNTERLSLDTCVTLASDLVTAPEFQETEASRAILDDKVLEARIAIKLSERFTVATGVSGIRVE